MELNKIQEKIEKIEAEIQKLPRHKATEHHIGKQKAKLAKLRFQIIEKSGKKGTSTGFAIKKQGDATVVLVGFPSVGKSTLLNKLTNAKSKVAPYDFTTLTVIPGMLNYKGAKIQILDVPGLIKGASLGKGRGKEVLSVIRAADLLILTASVQNPASFKIMEQELYLAGVRINQKKPKVLIEKQLKGGIEILGKPKSLSKQTIKSLAQEFGILNAKITFQENVNQDQLIDVLIGNRVYVPAIKVLSKIDLTEKITPTSHVGVIAISAQKNIGLKKLKNEIFKNLNFIRIYLKESARKKPGNKPLICNKEITVFQAAEKISQELAQEIKGAKINGPSASHKNQFVGLKHILQDKDEVFFVKK